VRAVMGGALLLLVGCSTSPQELEQATEDLPGVISVEAAENDGDDPIPLVSIPKTVDIVMEEDVSASEVKGVFDEYEREIDEREVESVHVALDGQKDAVLITGEGIHATMAMAEDLVAAAADEDITAYRREAFPVLPGVDVRLAALGLDRAIGIVGRYRDAEEIELIQVVSGGFVLIRDAVNGDPALYDARERFARRVNNRFGLTGAVVSSRGPLELFVTATDQAAASRFVARTATSRALRRVIVRTRD